MGNEMFQARVDDDFADRIHEYREENHMAKSEVVRAALRDLVDDDQEDAEQEVEERRDRLQALARLGERTAAIGTVLAFSSMLIWIVANLAISTFNLTVGTFGAWAVIILSLLTGVTAIALITISVAGLVVLAIRHGIETGWFGRTATSLLGRRLTTTA